MTIEEMKKRKKELGFSCKKISELSKVPLATVQKIFSGKTASPRYDTIQALTGVLAYTPHYVSESVSTEDISFVSEPQPEYNANPIRQIREKGPHTIDEYIALPEGTRVELIDGQFYNMAAPTTIHQNIGTELWALFKDYIRANGGKCVPFVAPTDVQLDCDNKTMVQPDVLVVCDRDKITKARIVGAPDLIVEIVSPSNACIDVLIKMLKYKKAGVREYWIIFPEEKMVMVYNFEKNDEPKQFTFDDIVPVEIWDGKCCIDFKYIYSQVEFIYEK